MSSKAQAQHTILAEQQLLLQAGEGDMRAFEEIVRRYQQPIYAFCHKLLYQKHRAEDLTQETFLKLWSCAARWRPECSLRSYLYLIAKRLVYNELRKSNNKTQLPLDELGSFYEHSLEQGERSLSGAEMLAQKEAWLQLDAAIAKLPKKQQMALLMRKQELSYQEIANALELSVSALKSQLFRARQTLSSSLSEEVLEALKAS